MSKTNIFIIEKIETRPLLCGRFRHDQYFVKLSQSQREATIEMKLEDATRFESREEADRIFKLFALDKRKSSRRDLEVNYHIKEIES